MKDKAKQQVCSTLAPDGYDWYECVFEQAKEDGEALGFDIQDIHFTGFYSQGDGASWTGYVHIIPWLEKHYPDDPKAHILIALMEDNWLENKIAVSCKGHYNHSNTMLRSDWYRSLDNFDGGDVLHKGIFEGASVETLVDSLPAGHLDDLADEMLQSAKDYADDIYRKLRDEYAYQCSEEVIAEMCDANEYLFTEEGKLI